MDVLLEDMSFQIDESSLSVETETNEPTNNVLSVVSFECTIIGKEQLEKLKSLLEKTFDFNMPEKNIAFRAKKDNHSYSFRETLGSETIIKCKIRVKEQDKSLPEDWNFPAQHLLTTAYNWVRTRAISELLVEKGIITQEEYEEKLQKLIKRDSQDMCNSILFGKDLPVYPKKNED